MSKLLSGNPTKRKIWLRWLFVAVFLVVSKAASWENSALLNFDGVKDGVSVTNQFAGLLFANATVITAGVTLNELEFPPHSENKVVFNDGGAMSINFLPPVYGIECYVTYGSRLTLTAYDINGLPLGTALSQFPNNQALSGTAGSKANELLFFSSLTAIAKIAIASADNTSFALDDFRITDTTVPTIYEADVSPRPKGNQAVTLSDWVQVGRFAVGLDPLVSGSEYQRADCAPKATKGDGVITIGDWVQAGRYAVGLDPLVSVGGTTTLLSLDTHVAVKRTEATTNPSNITAVADTRDVGVLFIRLAAQGAENALAFSLAYDPATIEFISASLEAESEGAALLFNRTQTKNGKVGLALALPPGKAFQAKASSLLKVRFMPVGNHDPASTTIRFSDAPTKRNLVDAQASNLPSTFSDVVLTLRGREGTSRRSPTTRGTTPRP